MRPTLVLVGLLGVLVMATACGGQQASGLAGSSSKAGGPRIELAETTPSRCGMSRCQVAVTVRDAQGQAIEDADVRFEGRHAGMNMSPSTAGAEHRGGGRYEGAMNFSMAGDWNVGVQVRLPGNNTVYSETVRLAGVR